MKELPTPTRTSSYSFAGWFTSAIGGSKVTLDTVFDKDTEIFAHWTYIGGSSNSGSTNGETTSPVTNNELTKDKAVDATKKAIEKSKNGQLAIISTNAGFISFDTFKAMSSISGNKLMVQADTTYKEHFQGRIYLYPHRMKSSINLGVYTT